MSCCPLIGPPVGDSLRFICLLAGTVRAWCVDQYVDLTADKLLWLIDTSALSGLCVLAHVISLVGCPNHVTLALHTLPGWTYV